MQELLDALGIMLGADKQGNCSDRASILVDQSVDSQ